MNEVSVGEIRPSQLLRTYGPGALIDLPNLSIVTMGIDRWQKDLCEPIQEERLLTSVKNFLGPTVGSLRMPPAGGSEDWNPSSGTIPIGVPVKPFPRWLRCVKCGLLSNYDVGLFKLVVNKFRPELTRFVHEGCGGKVGKTNQQGSDAVPARFLIACRAGHLDDFSWSWFVHGGISTCRATLRFFESGASLQTENLWVKCDGCGAAKNMALAFGQAGRENLPACRGRHPHVDEFEECLEEPRTILLGATNSWFPVILSVLAIPQAGSPIAQLIADGWTFFEEAKSVNEISFIVSTLKKTASLPGIERFSDDQIWEACQAYRDGTSNAEVSDVKSPEWDVLTSDEPPTDYPHFMTKKVGVPPDFCSVISRVLLLERLREVNALLGFTRIESPDESLGVAAPITSLQNAAPEWVPAAQTFGEGIFVQFKSVKIKAWANLEAVRLVNVILREGHYEWRKKRNLDPNQGYPGVRYVMLHTFAHMLIREFSLECGYNAASIRERIYADVDGGQDQAGFLIYTAAADSDGTLGGLVELGKPENLNRLIAQALDRSVVCASDPLCAEHDPRKDQSLHGAACHACSFISETSCERGNRHLDRSLVVPTFDNSDAAFF